MALRPPRPSEPATASDEAIMARCRDGDAAAFGQLFARHGARIYAFLRHGTGSPALAEDLSQETWLRLYQSRHQFVLGSRFLPWLYTIAANLRRDSARARRRRPEDLTADGQLPAGRAAPAAPEDERAEAVRQALAALPESYRDVILLHRWHDLSFAEIARVLDTTEGAVKVRAHRGYTRLRELLQARGIR